MQASSSCLHPQLRLTAGNCSFDRLYRLNYWLMLPDTNHNPSILFKDRSVATIPLDVLSDLRLPIGAIRRRKGPVVRAAMPEAAVNENRDLLARENEIRTNGTASARLYREVNSISETCGMSGFPYRLFRSGVAAAVGAHDLAPSLRDVPPAVGSRLLTLL